MSLCYLIIKVFFFFSFSEILLLWGVWNSIQKTHFLKTKSKLRAIHRSRLILIMYSLFWMGIETYIRLLPCFGAISFIILWKFPCFVIIFKIHVGGSSCYFCFFCFSKQWYVLYPNEGPWYELLVIPLRFELLCSIMIPISIKVS